MNGSLSAIVIMNKNQYQCHYYKIKNPHHEKKHQGTYKRLLGTYQNVFIAFFYTDNVL